MNKWTTYHKFTEHRSPRNNVVKFFNEHKNLKGLAIDLGCGSGSDTVYLIEHGWNVISIDSTNVEALIRKKLNTTNQDNFTFQFQKLEDLHLPKCDLIISNYSLPFCDKKYFNNMWTQICNSINFGGYFVGNFFGLKDEWNNELTHRTFLSKDDALSLFKDFEILEFEEIKKDSTTASGTMKHWHIFNVVAKSQKLD